MRPTTKKTKKTLDAFGNLGGLLLALCLFFSTFLIAQESKNACLECHKELVSKVEAHGPTATDCTSCHEPTGEEHSNAKTTGGFKLFATGSAMCYECHTELEAEHKQKYVHKPLKTGECTSCHNIHSADYPKLLISQSPDLCLSCHEKFVAKKELASTIHTASFEGEACSQCHTPHASKIRRLLVGNSKELCLNCHNKKLEKDGRTIMNIEKHLTENSHSHNALKKSCTACHSPHYSERRLLLKETFPDGNYAKGLDENYVLCFNCHDTDLLNLENTTTATEFRDNDRNLHFVHVNKEKGRSCTNCHDVHAANNTKLIAETVKFGRWDMPLNFIEKEDGGTCATGCHKEQSYTKGTVEITNE